MTLKSHIKTLRSETDKSRLALCRVEGFIDDYIEKRIEAGERKTEQALVLAQALSNYYTCLETIFFRISQFFENDLPSHRWHQALLNKMTLRIDGVREPVVSDATADALGEILKFRHFTRYYFSFDYDWDKLEFLIGKFRRIRHSISAELDEFDRFLADLADQAAE